ncbi:MAG: mucoidy inhibitor MuiA family protein [Flavobacteriales bacterium]
MMNRLCHCLNGLAHSAMLGCMLWIFTAAQAQNFDLLSAEVYENGARMKRVARVTLNAEGFWSGILNDLDLNVEPSTIQVHLPETWSMAGVGYQHAPNAELQRRNEMMVKQIQSEIESVEVTRSMRMALRETYAEELAMLLSNRQVGGQETLLVEDLREAANFWRERVKELKYSMLELDLELAALDDDARLWHHQVDSLKREGGRVHGAINLRLQGPANTSAKVEVDYVIPSARWRPVFEAKVNPSGVVEMHRFAEVSQRSGSDWVDLDVVFAAGNPMQSLSPPSVKPLRLKPQSRSSAALHSDGYEWGEASDDFELNQTEAASRSARMDGISVNSFDAGRGAMERYRFQALGPIEILGSGQPERVDLGAFELQGQLRMLSLPAFSDEAYQMVSTSSWAGSDLMPGEVQVIAGGAYRGAFQMELPAPGDTLEFPVGQDPQIRSSRIRQLDKCKSSALGGKKSTEVVWEITLLNQHQRTVDIRVVDQVPLAAHPDIEVEVQNTSGGDLDAATGEVSWPISLGPGEQRKLLLAYKVIYPKSFHLPNF